VGPDPVFAGPAKPRIAKRIQGGVFALVPVVFFVELFDQYLYFVVGQRRVDVFEVVLNEWVFPVHWMDLLEIDTHVEEGIVSPAFWNALCAQGL
jgi:hypothetical protein